MTLDLTWENYWRHDVRQAGKKAPGGAPMESVRLQRGRRELFIDNWVIEHMSGLKRTLHHARRHPGNPVLVADKPWEEAITWASAIYDAQEERFKCWYKVPTGLAYATSPDGIHWDKELQGGNTNIVSDLSGDSVTVIKDTDDPDPSRRYKYMVKGMPGIRVGFSLNGIHWTPQNEPVITPAMDPGLADRCTLMRDAFKKRYIAFTKREMNNPFGRGDWGMIHRCRCVSFSDDFQKWTDPQLILRPDDCDAPDLQIYGLVGFNYEGMYLGLMDVYHSGEFGALERTTEIQLACSRDGEHWWRAGNRKALLTPDTQSSWERFMVFPMNCPPVMRGEEMWFFYRGRGDRRHRQAVPEHRKCAPWLAPGHEDDPPLGSGSSPPEASVGSDPAWRRLPGTGMGIAVLRRDGFVSLDAEGEGELWTRPLLFEGSELHINADASASASGGGGSIRVEVYPVRLVEGVPNSPSWNWAIDSPAAGLRAADCVPLTVDSTDSVIRWESGATLDFFKDCIRGKPVVLRFILQRASLYSFWIA